MLNRQQMKSAERVVVPIDRRSRMSDYLRTLVGTDERLVVVSNRGPLSFARTRAGEWRVQRGSGGL